MKKVLLFTAFVFLLSDAIAQDYKFGKVSKEELEEKFYPLDSTANAAYLYNYRRTHYTFSQTEGFQVISEFHQRIKIYTKEGFEYATRTISYYKPDKGGTEKISSLSAVTYNLQDGKVKKTKVSKKNIFDEKLNENISQKKLTFPDIKEGIVLEFKYKLTSPYEYSIDDLDFQYAIPVKKFKTKIEIPEFYTFNQRAKGFYSIPVKRNSKYIALGNFRFTMNTLAYEAKDIPALKNDEPFVSNVYNYRGGIKFELAKRDLLKFGGSIDYFNTSWDKVTKQIYQAQSFGGELKKSSYYKDDLATLLASSKTEIEKIANIYQFVKSKVKWNGYYGKYSDVGVRKAYKEGVGNSAEINLMLTSMLRNAGIEAHPVLVSSRSNGIPLFPTTKGFNYVVSVAFIGEKYMLLDATEPYALPNVLPTRALNWNGRIVRKNGSSSWIPLVSSKPALVNHTVNAKINIDEGIIEGLIRSKYDNLSALNFRSRYNVMKDEEVQSKLEEDYNIEIENFRINNKASLGKPIVRMVKFSSEDLIEGISNKLYINPLLFFNRTVNPFKSEERKFPVEFDSPWKTSYMISMSIPEGYSVESIPEPLAIGMSDDIGIFKIQVKQTGNKINVMSSIEFNEVKINPSHYKELKGFYKQMIDKEAEKIILVKS